MIVIAHFKIFVPFYGIIFESNCIICFVNLYPHIYVLYLGIFNPIQMLKFYLPTFRSNCTNIQDHKCIKELN